MGKLGLLVVLLLVGCGSVVVAPCADASQLEPDEDAGRDAGRDAGPAVDAGVPADAGDASDAGVDTPRMARAGELSSTFACQIVFDMAATYRAFDVDGNEVPCRPACPWPLLFPPEECPARDHAGFCTAALCSPAVIELCLQRARVENTCALFSEQVARCDAEACQ